MSHPHPLSRELPQTELMGRGQRDGSEHGDQQNGPWGRGEVVPGESLRDSLGEDTGLGTC